MSLVSLIDHLADFNFDDLNLVKVDNSTELISLNIFVSGQSARDNPSTSILCTTPSPLRDSPPNEDPNAKSHQSTILFDIPASPACHDRVSTTDTASGPTLHTLPFTAGLYMLFDDTSWWDSAPPFVDVLPNIRVVSLNDRDLDIPSIETETGRTITLSTKGKKLSISRASDSMALSSSIHPLSSEEASNYHSGSWTMSHVPADRPTKLPLNSHNIVVEYRRPWFAAVWTLVHRHRTRGEEVYLIIYKEKEEGQE